MNQLNGLDQQLFELTKRRPVGLIFTADKPSKLERAPARQPSGCAFWKLAEMGRVFYAEASDHFGCPVGAYVMGADLPELQLNELKGLGATMVQLSYLTQKEVTQLPRREEPLRYVIYAPLRVSPAFPDLVIVRGTARALMLLCEAATAAGVFQDSTALRPACAFIPRSTKAGKVELSLGCVGNRVYTGLEDGEGYVAIPGEALEITCKETANILKANHTLEDFHRQKQAQYA